MVFRFNSSRGLKSIAANQKDRFGSMGPNQFLTANEKTGFGAEGLT